MSRNASDGLESRLEQQVEWPRYLDAAQRKAEIARYHLGGLLCVVDFPSSDPTRPAIPVQAHFEGIVIAAIAAVDQIAQAINSALRLGLKPSELVQTAFSRVAESVPSIRNWFENPLGRDLRKIRRKMIHLHYEKTPSGRRWEVVSVDSEYKGSRELVSYASAAVSYVRELVDLIPSVEHELRKNRK